MITKNSQVPNKCDVVKQKQNVEVSCWNCFLPEPLDEDPEPLTLKKIRSKNREKFKLYPFIVSEISKPKAVPLSQKVSRNYAIGKRLEEKIIKDGSEPLDKHKQTHDKEIEICHSSTILSTIPEIHEIISKNATIQNKTEDEFSLLEIKRIASRNFRTQQDPTDKNISLKSDIDQSNNYTTLDKSDSEFQNSPSLASSTRIENNTENECRSHMTYPYETESDEGTNFKSKTMDLHSISIFHNQDVTITQTKIVKEDNESEFKNYYKINCDFSVSSDCLLKQHAYNKEQLTPILNDNYIINENPASTIDYIQGNIDKVNDYDKTKTIPAHDGLIITKESATNSSITNEQTSCGEYMPKSSKNFKELVGVSGNEDDIRDKQELTKCHIKQKAGHISQNTMNFISETVINDTPKYPSELSNRNEKNYKKVEKMSINNNNNKHGDYPNNENSVENLAIDKQLHDHQEDGSIISNNEDSDNGSAILDSNYACFSESIYKPSVSEKDLKVENCFDEHSCLSGSAPKIVLENDLELIPELIWMVKNDDVKQISMHRDGKTYTPEVKSEIMSSVQNTAIPEIDESRTIDDLKVESLSNVKEVIPLKETPIICNPEKMQKLEKSPGFSDFGLKIDLLSKEDRNPSDYSSDAKIFDKVVERFEYKKNIYDKREKVKFDDTLKEENTEDKENVKTKLIIAEDDKNSESDVKSDKKREVTPKIPSRTAAKEEDIEQITKGIQNISLEHNEERSDTASLKSKSSETFHPVLNEAQSNHDFSLGSAPDLNIQPLCSTPLVEKKHKSIFNSSLPVLIPGYRKNILKLSKSLTLDSKPSHVEKKSSKILRWNTLGTPTRIPVRRDEVYSSDSLSPGHATLPRRSSSPLPNDRDTLDRSRTSLNRSGLQTRSESMVSVYSGAGEGMRGGVTVSGAVQFSLLYNYRLGALEVGVKKCKDLAPVDVKRNRSDPYVKVYLLPDKSKGGKRKTKVKKNTLNPAFEETLSFVQPLASLSARTLWLSVWHADIFGRNDFLGEVTLPLADVVFDDPAPKWYNLHERTEQFEEHMGTRGDLIVGLKFEVQEGSSTRGKGTLHVLIKEAKNLVATKPNGLADVFCKSYLLPERGRLAKQKTGVVRRSLNPRWEHTFTYRGLRLQELGARALELSLWDRDRLASNDFMGAVRLSLGTGTYMGANVNWMDSMGKEVTLWQTMMQRPNFWVEGSLPLRPQLNN